MIDFFLHKLDPQFSQRSAVEQRAKYGNVASWIGILTNLLLATFKVLFGWLSQSIAIIGDGINNFSDVASAAISLFSFHLASKPADPEHPFGHARIEYVASSLIALFILYLGFSLGRESIEKIFHPVDPVWHWGSAVVLLISIIVKFWLSNFYTRMGKRLNSELMEATAADARSDIFSSGAILLSLVFSVWTGWGLDGYMGLFAAFIILRSGYEILMSTLDHLLGRAPDPEQIRSLEADLRSYDGVLGVHDLLIHDYGPGHQFVTVHVEVPASVDILLSHALIDRMEREISKKHGVQLTIHTDPLILDDPRLLRLQKDVETLIASLDPQYSIHDFRHVHINGRNTLQFDVVVPPEQAKQRPRIKEAVEQLVQAQYPEYNLQIGIDFSLFSEE